MSRVVYEADREAFLDRMRRARELKHMHAVDDAGTVHGFDMVQTDPAFVEMEGVYVGRWGDGPFRGLLKLAMGDKFAALADIDVLRCAEAGA